MKEKWPNLSSKAWIARFWAQYNTLPESLKKVFCNTAQIISNETEKQSDKDTEPSCAVMKEQGLF